jgi:hypothetical protein
MSALRLAASILVIAGCASAQTNPPSLPGPSRLPDAQVGTDYSVDVAVNGGQAPFLFVVSSGNLPPGLSLGPISGTISGRPTATGDYGFRVTVRDVLLRSDDRQFNLTVVGAVAPLSITTGSLPAGTTGVAYNQSLAASGGTTPYTWSVIAGSLPPGLSLSGTGDITGTPTAQGSFSFTARVADSGGRSATRALQIVIEPPPPAITTTSLAGGRVGVAYSASLAAAGGTTPYAWAISAGSLPAGLSLSGNTISGTPTAAGNSDFTVRVTDATNRTDSRALQISIAPPAVSVSTTSLPGATVGAAYSQSLSATGGTLPYTWAISAGSLPAGLSLSGNTISGTPTTAGSSSFTVRVTDAANQTDSRPLQISVAPPAVAISTTSLPGATLGSGYSQSLSATGGTAPYTWSIAAGSLPPGILLSGNTISGTPNATGNFDFTARVTDAANQTATQALRITVAAPAVTITTVAMPSATVGSEYSQALSAAGGTAPYTWAISAGSLPAGLSLNGNTISGTPTAAGSSDFTVRVTDAASQTATQAPRITVNPPALNVTTSALPPGTVAAAYSQSLAASGGTGPYTWAISAGSLPAGLSLSGNTISGTPTTAGNSEFTVRVTDSANQNATRALSITINAAPAPTITTTSVPGGGVNVPYYAGLLASGGTPPYSWAVTSGSLPAGVTLSSAGEISGTPTASGSFDFTVTVTDAARSTASRALRIVVSGAPPSITTTSPGGGRVGTEYSGTLSATGGTAPYTWSIVGGSLPPGLNLSGSGLITGTPTAAGSFDFTARVVDAENRSDSRPLQIVITAAQNPITITTTSLPQGTTNSAYSQSLSATGGTAPYSWAVTGGNLPPGINIAGNGAVSGTPTSTGTFSFTVRVTDAANVSQTASLQIVIAAGTPPPSITTSSLPGGTVDAAYSQSAGASGGTPPYTWSLASGSLPAGLNLSSSGVISGTPTASGTSSFGLRVTDAAGQSATRDLQIVIAAPAPAPTISTNALPSGTVSAEYAQSIAATGGTPPYSFTLIAGTLPAGVSLAPNGNLTGTPSSAGTFDFTVRVTDGANQAVTKAFRIVVGANPAITTSNMPPGTVGTAYAQNLGASGGTPPYTWSVVNGSLPAGLSLAGSTGRISGTPTSAGNSNFTVRVSDSAGRTADSQLSITVAEGLSISACPAPVSLTGVPYSSQLGASGGVPPYRWSVSGQLPPGLALDSNAGTLTGTPLTAGGYSFLMRVTDSASQSATRSCSVAISAGLTITTEGVPDATTRAGYSQTLTAIGGSTPYRWSTTGGSLPPGLTLDPATGRISGLPTELGRYQFVVTVADSAGASAERSLTINVAAGVTIPACPTPNAAVGRQYSSTISAIGGQTPYAWGLAGGSLPAGLTLAADTGILSGTPTTAGEASFTLRVNDGSGAPATRACTISVASQLVLTTSTLPEPRSGTPYSEVLTATGGVPPYTWTVSDGTLPPGLSLNAATGTISGSAMQAGTFRFTIRVTDEANTTAERAFTLNVATGLSITSCAAATGVVGQPYSSAFSVAGGQPPLAWTITSGSLPPGLILDGSNGTLSGTPSTIGTSDFVVRVAATGSAFATRTCSIVIAAGALSIAIPDTLPQAVLGVNYEQRLNAIGGRGPYTWALASGNLPAGLTLGADGLLRGTPSAAGSSQFTVRVTDQDRALATRVLTLNVIPAAPPTVSWNGLAEILPPAQQPRVDITLDNGYPVPLKGRVVLRFTPDPGIEIDDPSIQFVTGGRTVEFDVPANSTQPVFPVPQLAMQTGTVAGTIELAVLLTAAGQDVTPQPVPVRTIRIDRTAPVITSVRLTPITDGFEVQVTGYSTTREVSAANFQFVPAPGSRLDSNEVSVQTGDAARQWFRDPRSAEFGGQFTFVQPFTLRGATLTEVVVTLTNGQGTSQPARARF